MLAEGEGGEGVEAVQYQAANFAVATTGSRTWCSRE